VKLETAEKTVTIILTALRTSDVTERISLVLSGRFNNKFESPNEQSDSVSVFRFSHRLASSLYHNLITSSRTRNDGIAQLVYQRVDALVFNIYLKARCEILYWGTVTMKKCGPPAVDQVTWRGTRGTQVPPRTQDKTPED
jgi:hypothetical protein